MNRNVKPEVTILFPMYNEAETAEAVISEFYKEVGDKIPVRIMVVEDGSTDNTKEVLKKLSERIPMTLIMDNERKGYSKAVAEGLKKVDTKFVFFSDSDGQHLARDFWMLYGLKDKYDIISGWRIKRADSLHRRIMSKTFQLMAETLFNLPSLRDITAPFRLMKTEVAKTIASEFKYMKESFWTEFTIRACKNGTKVVEVGVNHRNRLDGSTTIYKPSKIPKIALSQSKGMLKLWLELKTQNHPPAF